VETAITTPDLIGRNPAPAFTEIARSDLLEWNYHIIYWFTMSLGDASSRVYNWQNIAAGSSYGVYVIVV